MIRAVTRISQDLAGFILFFESVSFMFLNRFHKNHHLYFLILFLFLYSYFINVLLFAVCRFSVAVTAVEIEL